jgi:outer membrane immunogenic protein
MLAAFAVVGFASITHAADMAVKAPPPPVAAPAYNWSGFYVGAVGTYGWGDSEHCQIGFAPPCLADGPFTNLSGWEGGGTLGFNWQLTNWVVGVEGDWSAGKLKGSSGSVAGFSCGIGLTCDTSITSIATARGRVGYAYDRFLPYLTAGAGFSRLNADIVSGASSGAETKTNFVWGGGLEVFLSPQWSAKAEYLNISNVGNFTYDTISLCGAGTPCYVHVSNINLVRLGLNYKFPVVGK